MRRLFIAFAIMFAVAAAASVPPLIVTDSTLVGKGSTTLPLGVNTSTVQSRVSGACGSGNAIQSINADGTVGCQATGGGGSGTVTSITEGAGIIATPNPITGAGTVAADTTYLQRRVSGACGAGNAIDAVNADGTVGCQSVGTGTVTGTGTTGDLPAWSSSTALGNYAGSTATACSAGQALTDVAISAAGALTGTCTAQPQGTVTGTGTTGDLMKWSSSTAAGNYAGSSPSACTAGSVVTDAAFSAAGALSLTCGVTPITGSLTTNTVPVASGTSALTNSGLTDNGTAFSSARDLNEFGSTAGTYYVSAFGWECKYGVAANSVCHINQHGASDGTTVFRDLSIDDGKGNAIAYYTGSTKGVEFMGAATVDGDAQWGNSTSDMHTIEGGVQSVSTSPSVIGCGTIATNSSASAGQITFSTASTTSCNISLGVTYAQAPFCTCSSANTSTSQEPFVGCLAPDTQHLTIYATSATSAGTFTWHCIGGHS